MNRLNDAFQELDNFLNENMETTKEESALVDTMMGHSQHAANERLREAIESQRVSLESQGQRLMQAIDLVRQAAERRPKRIKAPSGKVYEIED